LESKDEKNLSTKPNQAYPHTRLSSAHVNSQWPQGADGPSCKGADTPSSLIDWIVEEVSDACFPKAVRLQRREHFDNVFAEPRKSVDSCFTVFVRRNGSLPARLGLAISKRNARRAVDRNRLKRVVRESFRGFRIQLHGIDIVVLCRQGAVTAPNPRLFSSLSAHWKRARDLLCEHS